MTQTKTKKALLMSVLSMVLCVAMLVGMTFAWFTDTASTGVNKIQAGNLDVVLEMWDGTKWVDAKDQTLNFVKSADAPSDEAVLWEPGCTYELPELRVVNKGNLALKYKVAISGLVGDSELGEVIDWYYGDSLIDKTTGMIVSEDIELLPSREGTPFTLKAHMQEGAGNKYQNLSLEGITITVYATQAASEYDSFDNQYDAEAEYKYIDSLTDLETAVAEGKNIILNSAIELDRELVIDKNITINGNGNAIISKHPVKVKADANVTITNVDFKSPTNANNNASNIYGSGLKGKLVLDGCSFSGSQWDCVQVTPVDGAEVVINNCKFELNEAANDGNKTRFIHIEAAQNSNADVKITLTNNFFGASTYINNALIDIDYINLAGIDFGGNNTYTDTTADIYVCGPSVYRTISKADAYKALGSKMKSVDSSAALNEAITTADTAVTVKLTKSGTYTLPQITNKTVTISGNKNNVVDMTASSMIGAQNGNLDLTLEGVTVKFANANNYAGITHSKAVTYKDCTIEGLQCLYADNVEFINCEFKQNKDDAYHIWTYGAKNVTFTKCKFYSTGESKAVLCYTEANGNTFTRTFNNCEFIAKGNAKKSAIMVNPTAYANKNIYVINVNNCKAIGYAENGISGQTIVGIKETVKDNITVNIDGTKVYTHN